MDAKTNGWKKLAALVLACTLLAGCGSGASAGKTEPVDAGDGIVITDLAGITHSFPEPLGKVCVQWSCAGGPFMTMSALLGEEIGDHLACMDDSPEKYRADVWNRCMEDVPALKDIPVIGSANEELNLEGVLASGAEAFIAPLELKRVLDDSIAPKLETVGIPVIYVDFHQETVENHTDSTILLGKLFGKEERAQEIVKFYTDHREAVTQRVEELLQNRKRPSLYLEVGMMGPADFGNSFDNHYSWGSIANLSGGTSIGEGVVSKLGPLDSEYILSQDPDKIVFAGAWGTAVPDAIRMGYGVEESETRSHMEAYFTRPGWSELRAYRDHQVYAINHGLAREMYDCACFEFFAKVCFPEAFEDLDPAATLAEYYSRFMPYTLDGTWFVY